MACLQPPRCRYEARSRTLNGRLQLQHFFLFVHSAGFDLVDTPLDVVHLDLDQRMGLIIKSEASRRVKIDQSGATFAGKRLPMELSSSPAIECPTSTGR